MDKNSVIGLVLIGLLVIGYSIYMQPSPQEVAAMKRQRDSLAAVQKAVADSAFKAESVQKPVVQKDNLSTLDDSVKTESLRQQLDVFAGVGQGREGFIIVEKDLMKVVFSNPRGKV